jgi:hypothetical protein
MSQANFMSVGKQQSGSFKAVQSQDTTTSRVISIDASAWRRVNGVESIKAKGVLFLIRHQIRRLRQSIGNVEAFTTTAIFNGEYIKYTCTSTPFDCYIDEPADEVVFRWRYVNEAENDNDTFEVRIELLPGRTIRCTKGAEYLPFVRNLLRDVCLTVR